MNKQILILKQQNKTNKEICDILNISKSNLYRRLSNIKLTKKIKEPTKDDLYKDYVINNNSTTKIAKIYGYKSSTSIRLLLKKYNIERNNKYYGPNLKIRNGYKDISGSFWYQIKYTAQKRKIDFLITIEDAWNKFVEQNKKCLLTGETIILSYNKKERTASLDRIDSKKGYTKENIQWIHKNINEMKLNFSQEYFIELCTKISNYNKKE